MCPDNVDITAGTGTTVATDLVGTAHHQRVKVDGGGDGVSVPILAGGGVEADALRVTIASDSTGVVSIDDNGGAITVDGTVAVTGTFWQATQPVSAAALPLPSGAATATLQGGGLPAALGAGGGLKVDGSGTALPISVATIPSHAVTNAGTFATQVTSIAAGENLIGKVGFPDIVVTVTPTVDTSAYESGDLLFDSAEIANAVRVNGGTCILQNVTILDKADQGSAFTLIFANAATDFGTIGAAPNPDDTEALTVIGHVAVATGDYIDLVANKVACIKNIGLLMQAGAATTSLYVAALNGAGTPTYGAAGDLVIQFGLLRG